MRNSLKLNQVEKIHLTLLLHLPHTLTTQMYRRHSIKLNSKQVETIYKV